LKACEQNNGMRVLADYISGMTDEFASRLYGTLFSPRQGGIQDNFHG
jgi:dGTPase